MVFTRAGCSNVEKKWNELLRTSKSYRSLLPVEENSDRVKDGEENNKRFVSGIVKVARLKSSTAFISELSFSEVDIKFAPIDVVLVAEVLIPFIKMVSGGLIQNESLSKHVTLLNASSNLNQQVNFSNIN